MEQAEIAKCLLPQITDTGSPAGSLVKSYAHKWGLDEGIPVYAAIGDNQASLFAALERPEEQVAPTLGTVGQFSVIVPSLAQFSQSLWAIRDSALSS